MAKRMKEKFKTLKGVFDLFTEQTLHRLISRRLFDGLESPIFVGKESNVFTALKNNEKKIVKIYRLETCDFNQMYNYLKHDFRFRNLKKQKRKVILTWVQREYRNLLIARDAKVRVPTPLAVLNNVLVLEFIGDKNPAQRVKDRWPKHPKKFFNILINEVKKLYKAKLIHADLSQFNILNHNETPVIIDFSQSTTLSNPRAQEYLERDIRNICNFFRKIGVKAEPDKVLKKIQTI